MRKEYDFSKMKGRRNPYAGRLKKPVTIRLGCDIVDYFKKMAGQMGHTKTTTKNLRVAIVDQDLKIIALEGAVPGPRKGIVLLKGVQK